MKRINSFFSVTLLAAVMFSSCQDREVFDSADHVQPSGEQVKLHLGLNIQSNFQSGLRAISATEEQAIKQIDVLVFKEESPGGVFVYSEHVEGTLSDSSAIIKTNYEANQQLVVITNARDEVRKLVDNTSKGVLKDKLLELLTFSLKLNDDKWNATGPAGTDNFTAFPMWGESAPTLITKNSGIIPVKSLLRMVARIDVVLDQSVTEFEIDSVFLYNTNIGGRIVPDTLELAKDKATLPLDADLIGTKGKDAYIKYIMSTTKGDSNAIYTFETAAPSTNSNEATCLIIAGRYKGTTCYYRVDFVDLNDPEKHADILRNHCYKVTITRVTAEGYDTRDKAFQGKSINIETDLQTWENAPENVVVDGQYYLLVDTVETLKFSKEASTNINITVKTDYPTENAPVWEVSSNKNWVTPSKNGETLSFTVKDYAGNNTDEEDFGNTIKGHTAEITVSAGRLKRKIIIKQADVAKITITFSDYAGTPYLADIILNTDGDGRVLSSESKEFKVAWTPSNAKLYLWQNPAEGLIYSAGILTDISYFGERQSSSAPSFTIHPGAQFQGDCGVKITGQVTNGFQTLEKSIVLKIKR
ncbi:hypothetical protein AGMMS49965_09300 [Bacteroidia bacterium]|nr:hypothetical protein AGMMS49965_09300 [Bacteroidia bacterium]